MTTATSVHRCLAGRDCRRPDSVDDTRHGALTEHANTLCPACLTHIESAIGQLPRDWQELRATLGERAATTGAKIRSTPTPAIPISTRKEAIMAAIVDMADRAAAIVSDALHTDQPTGRGKPDQDAAVGSVAWCAYDDMRSNATQLLAAAIAITEPNVDLLASAPAEPALVWKKPQRCDTHQHLIGSAEAMLAAAKPREINGARDCVRRAYTAAGACDDCNGWGQWGQERELVEHSGLDIALQLVELHNTARAELGLTRLRIRYSMPCPDCGARVFRNDGESIVQCEGDSKHTCTEREYKVRAGLRIEERTWTEMQKYFLAEGYWRLDCVQELIDKMSGDQRIDLPGAGTIILDLLKEILQAGPDVNGVPIGHQRPKQRASGTDRRAAMQRQVDEDNWNWKNEKPYQPPKPKHRKATRPVTTPISASSLTMLVESGDVIGGRPANLCGSCNMLHAGDCP